MNSTRELKIGVLALQGAFAEHIRVLNKFSGVYAVEVLGN
jgi:glutamine amidotransferase PdxT